MSHFTHSEACPKCRKEGNDITGDNLAVYSDGHKYCFRCRYFVPADSIEKVKDVFRKRESPTLDFPVREEFSLEALQYLKSFGLTNDEIEDNLQGHEDGYAFLDSKFYLIRRLHKKPKVIIKGDVVGNEPVFGSSSTESTIVLVEDLVSAIKVSRVYDTCALLKTAIHDILLYRLASRYDRCILWLDPDMHKHMVQRLYPSIRPFFKEVEIVMSDKDPKYYSTDEILDWIDK